MRDLSTKTVEPLNRCPEPPTLARFLGDQPSFLPNTKHQTPNTKYPKNNHTSHVQTPDPRGCGPRPHDGPETPDRLHGGRPPCHGDRPRPPSLLLRHGPRHALRHLPARGDPLQREANGNLPRGELHRGPGRQGGPGTKRTPAAGRGARRLRRRLLQHRQRRGGGRTDCDARGGGSGQADRKASRRPQPDHRCAQTAEAIHRGGRRRPGRPGDCRQPAATGEGWIGGG